MNKTKNPIAALLVDIVSKLQGHDATLSINVSVVRQSRCPIISVRAIRYNGPSKGVACQSLYQIDDHALRDHRAADLIVTHAVEQALRVAGFSEQSEPMITLPDEPAPERPSIQLGPELFRFDSFDQWVNKAPSWYRGHRDYVSVDAKGRICQIGKQFMRARDEGAFPVIVYSIEPEAKP